MKKAVEHISVNTVRATFPPLHHADCNTTYAQKSLSHYKALAIMRD